MNDFMGPKVQNSLADQILIALIDRYRKSEVSSPERKFAELGLFDLLMPQASRYARLQSNLSTYDVEQVALDSVLSMMNCYLAETDYSFSSDVQVISILKVITVNNKKQQLRKQHAFRRVPFDSNGNPARIQSIDVVTKQCQMTVHDPALICEHQDETEHLMIRLNNPQHRDMVVMRQMRMTYREIASKLGLNLTEVRSAFWSMKKILAPHIANRDQRPETRDQRPETRDQRPETRDQRPETRDQATASPDFLTPIGSFGTIDLQPRLRFVGLWRVVKWRLAETNF